MQRGQRAFVLLYGLAMIIFAGTIGFRLRDAGVALGTTGIGLVLAALGLFFAKDDERLPAKRWVIGVLLLVVLQLAALFPSSFDLVNLKECLRSMAFLVPYGAFAFVVSRARPRYFQRPGRRMLRAAPAVAIIAGAVAILWTLWLTTTDEAAGWQILAQKKQWITYDYDLAGILADRYNTALWIRPLFAVGGYAAYLMAILSGLAAVAWVVRRGASIRFRRSLLLWLAVASGFATFYFFNDIFWGWMAVILDSGEARWPAFVGLVLEFAAVAGVLLMATVAARRKETWRELSLLQVAQLPIAGFNLLMMPDYFGGEIYLPGLAVLMMGSQMLTWGCLGALFVAASEDGSAGADASSRLRARSETSLPA